MSQGSNALSEIPGQRPQSALEVLQRTTSLCPECLKMLPADLVSYQGDVWMRKFCPDHGEIFSLYWRDAKFFNEAQKRIHTHTVCQQPICARGEVCHEHWDRTTTIMVNVTERCNYDCPICFSESNNPIREDMSLNMLKELLPLPKGKHRPNVVFVGGEPTMSKELPDMIAYCTSIGYVTRLVTNGSRLTTPGYAKNLYEAGLRWVVLQFDGFKDEIHQALRRRNLLEVKPKMIAAIHEAGMRCQLATMVKKDTNLGEISGIIRYGLSQKEIFWCSTYPHSSVHKNQTEIHQTHVIDVMEALEQDLGGQVTRQDFLDCMDLFRKAAALKRDEHLTQKLSIYPIVLFREGEKIVPLNRLASLKGALRHRGSVMTILQHFDAFMNFETKTPPQNSLFFTIEKFHNDDSIDLEEASQCHMGYLTSKGLVPFDIYNTYFRRTAPI